MPEVAYENDLGEAQSDWIRIGFTTFRGDVVDFVVQYETLDRGRRVAVVRYDCAHEFPHVDVLNRRGDVMSKTPLPNNVSLNDALQNSIADIKQNWRTYRRRFFGDEP